MSELDKDLLAAGEQLFERPWLLLKSAPALEFLPPVLGQIRANGLRAIAVTSRTRFTLLPDVPTLNESGLAGYEVNSWNGIAAAVRTPHAIVERLNKELHAAVNSRRSSSVFRSSALNRIFPVLTACASSLSTRSRSGMR